MVLRLLLLLVGAIGVFYAAAYAVARPDTIFAKFVIYGVILLFAIFYLSQPFDLLRIIKNIFREDD
ncbi:MAG: hypothetical protein CL608_16920 [Anaerolineaceae bacterium]|nr:hypothetical protein [Anaerolineaceae bacterium]